MGIRDRSIMGLFMDSIISPLDLKYRNKSIQGILINMKSSGLVVNLPTSSISILKMSEPTQTTKTITFILCEI